MSKTSSTQPKHFKRGPGLFRVDDYLLHIAASSFDYDDDGDYDVITKSSYKKDVVIKSKKY